MAPWTPERPCPIPGHPQDEFENLERPVLVSGAWQQTSAWLLRAPAERLPLPAFAAAWPTAFAMHWAQVPVTVPLCATCAAAGVTFLTWWRQDDTLLHAKPAKVLSWLTWWRHEKKSLQYPRVSAAEAAGVAAAIGGWMSLADIFGPLGGPDHLLSLIYLAGWGFGYRWLRRHEAVRAARQRRDDAAALQALKAAWHQILPRIGLGGWHLSDYWETNLGYQVKIVGSPEGELATRIQSHSGAIAEKLSHILGLPYNRVDIDTTEYPGELLVGVRTVDIAVRKAAYHPMTMPWPEEAPSQFAGWFPESASIRDPWVWGFTPEDGSPLSVHLINELGGRVIGVMGTTGSGKSNLLNGLREFVTRCPDARMVQLNGAHMGDEKVWEPLSALTLCGSVAHDEMLRNDIAEALAALCLLVTNRSATLSLTGDSVFQPTPEDPAVIAVIDEIDEIVAHVPGAGQMLEFLASKQRKSAVGLAFASQRMVITSIGGGNVRANMGEVLVGLVDRDSEARHATGADASIPDIRDYSKGQTGYFQDWSPRAKTVRGRGRAFLLGTPPRELACITRLVDSRRYLRDWGVRDMPDMALDGGQSAMSPASSTAEQDLAAMRAQIAAMTIPAPAPEPATRPAMPAAPEVQMAVRAARLGIPQGDLATLEMLLAAPDGVTSAQAGHAIGKSKSTAHAYLQAMERLGLAVCERRGRASRYARPAQTPSGEVPAPERAFPAPERAFPAPPVQAAGSAADAARAHGAEPGARVAARPDGYVTIHDLADAVHDGEIPVDEEQREVLAQVRQLRHADPPHPHLAVVETPESDAS